MSLKYRPYTSLVNAVARPRLLERCLQGPPSSARLTVVTAPAGFGKTVVLGALSALMAERGHRVAWLNCDDQDRDPALFLRSLLDALAHAGLVLRPAARDMARFLDSLARVDAPLSLFVDQYEPADYSQVDLLETIARWLPENVRMFVASRGIAPGSFVGLELDGFVRVVTAADLRFNDTEAHDILQPHVPARFIRELVTESNGWAFVLQLICLSARSRTNGSWDPQLVDRSRSRIAEFFASEVMSGLSETLRQFVLETSLLDVVTLEDAQAVTGRSDCAALIAQLQPLVPIVSLELSPVTARFHPLFRDYLRGVLQLRPRPEVVQLHERVAQHFAATRRVQKAVECALAVGSHDLAADIVEAAGAVRYMITEGTSYAWQLYQLLPQAVVEQRFRLRLLGIGALVHHDQASQAPPELARLEAELAQGRFAHQVNEEARIDLEVVRSLVAFSSREHGFGSVDWQALRADSARIRATYARDSRLWIVPLTMEIQLLLRQGRALDAAPLIEEYAQLARVDQGFRGEQFAWIYQSALNLATGDLEGAATVARKVITTCLELDGHDGSYQGLSAHALLGQVEYLRNNLRPALSHFEKLKGPLPITSFLVYSASYVWRAACDAARGRLDDALERLDGAIALGRTRRLQQLALLATAIRCELLSAHAEVGMSPGPESAGLLSETWREHCRDSTLPWITRLGIARALVTTLLGEGHKVEACALAQTMVEISAASDQRLVCAGAWVLSARALLASEQPDKAKQAVGRALALTDGTGATRLLLEGGRDVVALIREQANEGAGSIREWARQIVSHTSPLELLTPRQKSVLRELATGASTKEIARSLGLAPETVKFHLKVIYERLGTSSREGAARAAREADLVTES